jgi:superfamily II DNA or RNA helicase
MDMQRRINNLVFSESEFSIPENKAIFDEPRNTKPGYSFVDDPRNPWSNTRTLMQYILQTPSLFGRFGYVSESKIIWYPGAIAEYMKDAYELQNLLIVAVILTYGEPARATEIASNLLRNFPGGSIRNVFVTFGTFFLRGSFNKTSFFSGKDRVMCRAPLPSISRLFMRFLVFIRPLYSAFQLILRPHMHDNSVYFLFCGLNRPLTSVDISRTLHSFTLEKLGVGLPCSLHRQLMAFITSRYRVLFESHSISTGTEEQLGHSAEMDRQHYGLDASLPGQMDYNTVKTCLEISAVFHHIFGLGLELYSSIHAHRPRLGQMMKELRDVKYPAGGGVQGTATEANSPAPCDQVAAQIAYHLTPFLSQTVENKVNQSHAAVVHLFSPDTISQQTTYLSPEVVVQTEPRVLAKFREFMGDDQQLMGFMNVQQAQAAQLMVEGKRSFALITPTGSGKTMPGLLASKSFDRGRTTVWILPILAMHEQYLNRCRRYRLTCDKWHPSSTVPNTPQNLLVTIEATESERFHQFLLQLNQEGRLARVILDEAHLILTHDDFRPVMSTLTWLGEQAIQLVLLTATLPPALQTKLFQAVSLTGPLLLRLPTPRPNISFRVVRVPAKEDLEPHVVNVHQQALVEGDKILIFCSSRSLVDSYSQTLGVPGLHAQYSSEEIHDTIARFRAGEVRTIVATCILGVGLDVPAVTHVIHAGLPYDVISFAQEVGRLGRDKDTRKAWSVVVSHPNQFRKEPQEDLYGGKLMMEWFRDDRTCRRIALQTFLDGHAVPCAMLGPDVHLCDNCETKSQETFEDIVPPPNSPLPRLPISLPRPPPSHIPKATPSAPTHLQISSHHAQAQNAVARSKPHSEEYRTIKRLADHFSHRCIACVARRLESDHLFSQCKNGPSPTTEGEAWAQWSSCLQFSQDHCFFCGLPQVMHLFPQLNVLRVNLLYD